MPRSKEFVMFLVASPFVNLYWLLSKRINNDVLFVGVDSLPPTFEKSVRLAIEPFKSVGPRVLTLVVAVTVPVACGTLNAPAHPYQSIDVALAPCRSRWAFVVGVPIWNHARTTESAAQMKSGPPATLISS